MKDIGRRIFGLAAMFLGVVNLFWGDFAPTWQPVPKETPAYSAFAILAATGLIAGGGGLQSRRTAAWGSVGLAALYSIFMVLWLARALETPQVLAMWLGGAEQLALALAGLVIFATANREPSAWHIRASCMVFGTCLLIFGASHLVYLAETAAMVPRWLPPNTGFWAVATGLAHLAGGISFFSGVLVQLASRLVTAMFIGFGALVWLPQLFANPSDHVVWAGNAINLTLIGAAWVMADLISKRTSQSESARAQPGESAAKSNGQLGHAS